MQKKQLMKTKKTVQAIEPMQKKTGVDCFFIFPPISVSERYGNREIQISEGHLPPLGILYCAAYLEKFGFTAKVIDGPVSGLDCEQVAEIVIKENPRVVCISSITATFYRAIELATKIRKELPNTLILTGGHHSTIMPLDIMKEDCFDIAVIGEGEQTFLELMQALEKNPNLLKDKKELMKINGIFFKRGKEILKTEPRAPIQNLDEIPFAARHLIDMSKYKPLPNQYKKLPATNFVAIRGCLYNCIFCSNPAIFGHKIRAFSPRRVIDEIKYLKEKYGVKEISFWDDSLTINKEWMNELLELMINEKLNIVWSCYSRVNTVNLELLKKMKKAGCWNIFYGIETGDQELLNNIKKGTTIEQIRDAVKFTKKARIEVRGSFMIALPGETPELAKKTIDFAKSLDLDYAQFCITTPFPGTELWEKAEQYGTLDKNYDKYQIWSPVFVPFGYKNAKQIEEMEAYAMKEFYMRPKYIFKKILSIRSPKDILRYLQGLKLVLGFMKPEKDSKTNRPH